ncbi:hypothetical protein H0G86_002988 [Trichoderma simmonsii]|uniref:Uncharacterized protein n=1 Tax=Trichoderma simmonsii TaxID=1491479 RepID=A0A8G0L7R2_9HYPO|nr:hypothetical protein H0G86_002988 [Trichoderma simmonsii]
MSSAKLALRMTRGCWSSIRKPQRIKVFQTSPNDTHFNDKHSFTAQRLISQTAFFHNHSHLHQFTGYNSWSYSHPRNLSTTNMSTSTLDFRVIVTGQDFTPEVESKLADLLDAAINRGTSPEVTADGIDKLCPRNEDAEGFLWSLWSLLADVAKRIPLDDPRLQHLVKILKALNAKQTGSVEIWGSQHELWADMPLFGAVMREEWNASPDFDNKPDQATKIAQWLSLNSFAARLLGASVSDWTNFAIWELRDGLEEQLSTDEARDTHLITASEWITQAGQVLYKETKNSVELDSQATQALSPGSLIDGTKSGFNEERWSFWKQRLEELSANARAEAKKRTEKALEVIKNLEA